MKKLFLFICLSYISALFTSCLTTKPPEFKNAEHIKITNHKSEAEIKFDIVGNNPNNWSIRINEIKAQATMKGMSFVELKTDTVIRLKRGSDFSIPFSITISEKDIEMIVPSGLLTLLLGEDIPVEIKGEFVARKFLFRKRFPFQFSEKIEPKILNGLR